MASLSGRNGPPKPDGDYEQIALRHPEDRSPNTAAFTPSTHGYPQEQPISRPADSLSLHSTAPLVRPQGQTYPPMAHRPSLFPGPSSQESTSPTVENKPAYGHARPYGAHVEADSTRPNSSWDLLAGMRKFEQDYTQFDSRNATEPHLRFADGDVPKNKVSRLYNYLLNVSIITRWILFIVPVMGLLWIPGILGLTAFPDTRVWDVLLLWWSIWLSVVWGGWWAALAVARITPWFLRNTLGVVAIGLKRWVDWVSALHRYIATWSWSLSIWIAFNPLIIRRSRDTNNPAPQVSLMGKILFSIFLCCCILLFEKFSIQWVAYKFHERSYADRIAEQKKAMHVLVTLYSNSSDIPGRNDTMIDKVDTKPKPPDPARLFKRALKGVRNAATTTTTALGNVASEIAGSSVLQPDSPEAKVQTALESANKSRLLARRLFYSFRQGHADHLQASDIARYFTSKEDADAAFAFFDKDDNGDASRDEVEMACLECHREQLAIEHSMRDLDSAVGRLDNILMSLYVVIAAVILAVALEAQVSTLIAGAGTLVLGLSWLIGASCQEVLASIIFLFIKHPYDVGDRVDIDKVGYVVKEMRLLSTIFIDLQGCQCQVPNVVLNTKFIQNIRRSPQMSEKFEFEVAYSTTFEQIEQLRAKMLAFVKAEKRDFQPSFDVVVVDFPGQEKMLLSADIKYKSNSQQGAIKVKRRNKWICALKTSLAELEIWGPKGNPNAEAEPAMYTEVPWEEVQTKKREKATGDAGMEHPPTMPEPVTEPRLPRTDFSFMDKNASIQNDDARIYGESEQMYMTNPRQGLDSNPQTPYPMQQRPVAGLPMPQIPAPSRQPRSPSGDEIEMTRTTGRSGPLQPGPSHV